MWLNCRSEDVCRLPPSILYSIVSKSYQLEIWNKERKYSLFERLNSPINILSGFNRSCIAVPSARNSGFESTYNF